MQKESTKEFSIFKSLADEANDGWIWCNLGLPTRTVVKVTHPQSKRFVYCVTRQTDEPFLRKYNIATHRSISTSDRDVLVMSEWYRDALGVRAGERVKLDIAESRIPLWGSIRSACHAPDLVARLGTRLGVLGAWLGVVGLVPPVFDLFPVPWGTVTQGHAKAIGTVTIAALGAILGRSACLGVKPSPRPGQNPESWTEENIGIYAYGSLLISLGRNITPHVIDQVPCTSPWPVEYARKSRGGVPTLVKHPRGEKVNGRILVLDLKLDHLEIVREWLLAREGNPPAEFVKSMSLSGLKTVLYVDLPANIPEEHLNADYLADLAITSVNAVPSGKRNGIRYLAGNIQQGIITPLTNSYVAAVLSKTNARDLDEAEMSI